MPLHCCPQSETWCLKKRCKVFGGAGLYRSAAWPPLPWTNNCCWPETATNTLVNQNPNCSKKYNFPNGLHWFERKKYFCSAINWSVLHTHLWLSFSFDLSNACFQISICGAFYVKFNYLSFQLKKRQFYGIVSIYAVIFFHITTLFCSLTLFHFFFYVLSKKPFVEFVSSQQQSFFSHFLFRSIPSRSLVKRIRNVQDTWKERSLNGATFPDDCGHNIWLHSRRAKDFSRAINRDNPQE